jgi:hypothetical protein
MLTSTSTTRLVVTQFGQVLQAAVVVAITKAFGIVLQQSTQSIACQIVNNNPHVGRHVPAVNSKCELLWQIMQFTCLVVIVTEIGVYQRTTLLMPQQLPGLRLSDISGSMFQEGSRETTAAGIEWSCHESGLRCGASRPTAPSM